MQLTVHEDGKETLHLYEGKSLVLVAERDVMTKESQDFFNEVTAIIHFVKLRTAAIAGLCGFIGGVVVCLLF